ncbi:MAG: ribosome small subunit-dependent GTPase A, partial [Bacteroides sp.]|nr:ribosome small subunit-dependent GTPase A [Bacteroides sp.]
MQKGQIFKIHSDFYYVEASGETYECKLREVIKKQKQKVYVGDFVEFENGAIVKILPRENFITRPTVANVDQVIIISAVKEPELSFLQLNRYIAFAKYHNLKTVLCFNKNDLSDDDKTIEKVFSIYEPLGFDILFTSALEGFGLDEFREILKGKTSVLCGSSGVGKSSLINAVSGVNLRTKEVSEKTGRGTHTTRHSEIITIAEDTRIVDTPGFSNLKFDFLLPHDVDTLFSEIHPYKEHCKF